MKAQDQRYGLTEMEILLELDCGLDVEFKPNWLSENFADHAKVRWQLSDRPNPKHLDDLLSELEAEESVYRPNNLMESVRLLYRHDPGATNS